MITPEIIEYTDPLIMQTVAGRLWVATCDTCGRCRSDFDRDALDRDLRVDGWDLFDPDYIMCPDCRDMAWQAWQATAWQDLP